MSDLSVFQFLNNFAGKDPWLDGIIIFSAVDLGYLLAIPLLYLAWRRRDLAREIIATAVLAVILSRGVITEVIRYLHHKQRPFAVLDVRQIIDHSSGSAFPSGHAAFFFALSAAVFAYDRRYGVWFFVVATLISIARVIGGIHWPLDIIAGAVVGIFSAVLSYYAVDKFLPKRADVNILK
jgi:undecaprenyl-diphosphatase